MSEPVTLRRPPGPPGIRTSWSSISITNALSALDEEPRRRHSFDFGVKNMHIGRFISFHPGSFSKIFNREPFWTFLEASKKNSRQQTHGECREMSHDVCRFYLCRSFLVRFVSGFAAQCCCMTLESGSMDGGSMEKWMLNLLKPSIHIHPLLDLIIGPNVY